MDAHSQGTSAATPEAGIPQRLSPRQTILIIVALVPIIAGYIGLGYLLGVGALYMGFLFSTYWGALRMLAWPDYLPSLFGALTGIAIAYLLHALPAAFGVPGLLLALAAMVVALYFMMRQQGMMFLNPAFLVFLTVATIPALGERGDYLGMVAGLALGAAYAGGLTLLLGRLQALRAPRGHAGRAATDAA